MSDGAGGDSQLGRTIDAWNAAERAIKQAEQVNHEVVIPAISELRYAGRRLVEAVQKKNWVTQKKRISSLKMPISFVVEQNTTPLMPLLLKWQSI